MTDHCEPLQAAMKPQTVSKNSQLLDSTLKLLDYCRNNNWSGYDPYDVLNSPILKRLRFLDSKITRIILIQTAKRLPINIRPLLKVPKTENPKAIALFLRALIKLAKLGLLGEKSLIPVMADKLVELRSSNSFYWCWGYSFPWQTRRILVHRGVPNVVCTVFVAESLLDVYEEKNESMYLSMALNSAEYILNELYWDDGGAVAGLSYPLPSVKARVHNVNLLGAAFLCRVYKLSQEEKFLEPALKLARYSASRQHENGSWDYGDRSGLDWVDHFHTGYNLCALRSISEHAKISEFERVINRGFQFYHEHFFRGDNAPKYYQHRSYPIDIHNVSQGILTLLTFRYFDENTVALAYKVFQWAMKNMWCEKGYFYYQVLPLYKNRISYMRWSQAWMLFGLSTLLEHQQTANCKQT